MFTPPGTTTAKWGPLAESVLVTPERMPAQVVQRNVGTWSGQEAGVKSGASGVPARSVPEAAVKGLAPAAALAARTLLPSSP
jgi:hypothetical protein